MEQEQLISDDLIQILSEHIDNICDVHEDWSDEKYDEFKNVQLVIKNRALLEDTLHRLDTFEEIMNNVDAYIKQKNKFHSGFGAVKNGQKFLSIGDILSITNKEFHKLFSQDGW